MKISVKSRYALRALANLALKNKCCSVKEISNEENISFEYLEKIFSRLKKDGLVDVKRGVQGGYVLNRAPQDITVGEIIQSLEGNFAPVKCIDQSQKYNCPQSCGCRTQKMWKKIQDGFISTLNSITLASLIENS